MAESSATARPASSNAIQHADKELDRVGNPVEFESIHEALVECVKALGGTKRVAADLWPARAARDLADARRYLANCLSAERNEKLALDEVVFILRAARGVGCHAGMWYLAEALGYSRPTPIEPKDELADLLRQYLARREQEAGKDARLERLLQQHLALRSAA